MTIASPSFDSLKAELPEEIYWLKEDIQALVRPAAFLRRQGERKGERAMPAPLGATRAWGVPDIPVDARWAPRDEPARKYQMQDWAGSPYDGEAFYLQLNLADVPAQVRATFPHGCPHVGIVWVFINLKEDWQGFAIFDPRAIEDIVWSPRDTDVPMPVEAVWTVLDSLPCSTENTLPAIASNWDSLGKLYDDWVQDHYKMGGDIQVGGWIWPIQGDHDDRNETFVCALENQSFGDCGVVYLHYTQADGFVVYVETC